MSNLAIINKYDGGNAEDIRTENSNECEYVDNFDIYTTPHKLTPYVDVVTEGVTSGTITDFALTDVDAITVSGTTSLVALGRESSVSVKPQFFRKSSASDITSNWQAYAVGVNIVVPNSLTIFRNSASTDLRAYCLGDTGTAHNLQMFDGSATVSTIGTLTNTNYSSTVPHPFVHPEDNVMYFADGNIIGKYDGTTFTATAFTLPSNKVVVSFTNYGTYLVIVCRPKNGVGNSTMYFWGRDTSLTTVQESIDLGSSMVNIVENIENTLVAISTKAPVGQYANVTSNRLIVKVYTGGAMQVIKETSLSTSLGTAMNIIKQKVGEKLFFGFSNDTSIYVFGKNKSGQYFISHNRGLPSGTTTLTNFSIVGDVFFVAYNISGTNNNFRRSVVASESQTYNATATFRSTKNQGMIYSHRSQLKQLQAVQIMLTCPTSSGTSTLKYSVDGSAFVAIGSVTNVAGEMVIEAANESTDVEFLNGREFQFQVETTGGATVGDTRYRYDLLEQLT